MFNFGVVKKEVQARLGNDPNEVVAWEINKWQGGASRHYNEQRTDFFRTLLLNTPDPAYSPPSTPDIPLKGDRVPHF